MGFAASNNGLTFRAVASESDITTGEVYFNVDSPSEITTTELAAAFSGYAAAVKNQKLDAVNVSYNKKFLKLKEDMGAINAYYSDETTREAAIATLRTNYQTLKSELLAAQEAILNG